MYRMIFEFCDRQTLTEKNLSFSKIIVFIDEIMKNNNYKKSSQTDAMLTYQTIDNDGCFEDLLGVQLTLFNQNWIRECLKDWYLLSNEDSADGSFERQEILKSKYVRW